MESFWYIRENVPDGVGMGKFTPAHLTWLFIGLAVCAVCCLGYRRLSVKGRSAALYVLAGLLLLNEGIKWAALIHIRRVTVDYLPLHLCSINIFVCAAYAVWKNRLIGELLYSLCLPGALMALLFPSWSSLPVFNIMALHSITVHFELLLFPLLLIVGGMRPDWRLLPKCLLCICCAAVPVYIFDKKFEANFMFLNQAEKGTPLELFEKLLGNPGYIAGIVLMLGAVWLIMYLPWAISGKNKEG